MQLLKIQSIPIEYQLQVERAHFEVRPADNPVAQLSTTPSQMEIHTKPIQVRLDTRDMRSSIGLKSAPTLISEAAQRGMQKIQRSTAEFAQMGNQLAQIQEGVTVSKLIQQKMLQQPDTMTVFLPSVGPNISWSPNEIEMKHHTGNLAVDWKINQNVMDYVPGKFQMIIKQYPRVKIEYLGDPNYVPPSASPNYKEVPV